MQPERTATVRVAAVDWRDAYLRARRVEGHLLPDEIVAALPSVPRDHPLHDEWLLRADSSARLLAYLSTKRGPLRIVDAGCGNGWLAHRIAGIEGASVVGVDVNEVELDQARRVFGEHPTLRFLAHDFAASPLPVEPLDIVVLASAVQYVAAPGALIARLLAALQPGGEVHVIDTPVYDDGALAAARLRTARHYAQIGVPEMIGAYHHHAWSAFAALPMEVLHDRTGAVHRMAWRRLHRRHSPFPWLRFVNQERPR
ncbi:MAG TPA: class I SAM-dependent methyltransferase [Candidatus Dormibacteraeota bacterium]|jgi:SAM-dependent methyltransferase|nr:class I SAM-dependent methyltransferase [Candidatus Dormibacteraeota bacterium]